MDVKEYLQHRLQNCSKYELTKQDQKLLDKKGVEEFIFSKLMSKKFRKWKSLDSSQEKIKEVVKHCVSNNVPIRLNFSFGGFKLWRIPTTPEVDWSELFCIMYVSQYVAPILAVHKPGVFVDFSSADIAVTAGNNVPKKDVDQYHESFNKLLDSINHYFPENLNVKMTRLRDLFKDEEDLKKQIEPFRQQFRDDIKDDPEYTEELRKGSIQNLQTENGAEDLSSLSEEEMQARRDYSTEVAEGLYYTKPVQDDRTPDTIILLATKLNYSGPGIMIGTTRRTAAKFWAGMGVLAKNEDSFSEYVISPKQWERIKDQKHETIDVDLIDLKNFKQILVYPDKFDFTR